MVRRGKSPAKGTSASEDIDDTAGSTSLQGNSESTRTKTVKYESDEEMRSLSNPNHLEECIELRDLIYVTDLRRHNIASQDAVDSANDVAQHEPCDGNASEGASSCSITYTPSHSSGSEDEDEDDSEACNEPVSAQGPTTTDSQLQLQPATHEGQMSPDAGHGHVINSAPCSSGHATESSRQAVFDFADMKTAKAVDRTKQDAFKTAGGARQSQAGSEEQKAYMAWKITTTTQRHVSSAQEDQPIEKKSPTYFKEFAQAERLKLQQMAEEAKKNKLKELISFAHSFKLEAQMPTEIVSMTAKNDKERAEITQDSAKTNEEVRLIQDLPASKSETGATEATSSAVNMDFTQHGQYQTPIEKPKNQNQSMLAQQTTVKTTPSHDTESSEGEPHSSVVQRDSVALSVPVHEESKQDPHESRAPCDSPVQSAEENASEVAYENIAPKSAHLKDPQLRVDCGPFPSCECETNLKSDSVQAKDAECSHGDTSGVDVAQSGPHLAEGTTTLDDNSTIASGGQSNDKLNVIAPNTNVTTITKSDKYRVVVDKIPARVITETQPAAEQPSASHIRIQQPTKRSNMEFTSKRPPSVQSHVHSLPKVRRLTRSCQILPATRFEPHDTRLSPETHFPARRRLSHTPDGRYVNCWNETEIMLVTNGSCAFNGAGVGCSHGTEHEPVAGSSFIFKPSNEAAVSSQTSAGKIAFRVEAQGPSGDVQPHTSNRAKLRAAIAALEFLPWETEGWTRVVIVTDLEYIARGATEWIPLWAKRRWRAAPSWTRHGMFLGKKIANRDLWEQLQGRVETLRAGGTEVAFWLVDRHCAKSELLRETKLAAREAASSGPVVEEYTRISGPCRRSFAF
ncbi:unnamed protein product [Discula destructiva]